MDAVRAVDERLDEAVPVRDQVGLGVEEGGVPRHRHVTGEDQHVEEAERDRAEHDRRETGAKAAQWRAHRGEV